MTTDTEQHHASSDTGDTSRLTEQARQQAGAIWSDVKENTRAMAAKQQQNAASGIGQFAGALRNAAHQLGGEDQSPVAHRLASTTADRLDRLSGTLREKDMTAIARDVESFAREQPMVFFGAALAVGFLAVRFLKSSAENVRA